MFARLVQKELLHHLLDFRFIAVFALCALLSILSVYVGSRTYLAQLQEYNTVSERHKQSLSYGLTSYLYMFERNGYFWDRRPEVLSPVVHGLSGKVGREVHIQQQRLWLSNDSLFSMDPIHALFGVLDFAFIVEVILSLCVLLLTYDAVCGEKEGGTLRLYASFPVPRSTLALAKLAGSAIAVLVPFIFSFVLASAVLALSPDMALRGGDWSRMAGLIGAFALYLAVFAAFGLWISALTHRRMTAFLGLLGLWTVWVFIVPNLALRTAQGLAPVDSVYELRKQAIGLRWEVREKDNAEVEAYKKQFGQRYGLPEWPRGWNALSPERLAEYKRVRTQILARFDTEYYPRLRELMMARRNQMRRQQSLMVALSATSPLGAVSLVSMDLARTGLVQQERLEDALDAHHLYLARFIQAKREYELDHGVGNLTDFSAFTFQDSESLRECLSRNLFNTLNLALLAVLGFAGAYVAIVRYDVR